MKEFDFLSLLRSGEKRNTPTSVAIGVFDGFHLGHREIVNRLLKYRDSIPGSEAMIITFSSNPKYNSDNNIDTIALRKENLRISGIDSFVTIDFSQQFAKISASEFLRMVLSLIKLEAIVVGSDFVFGNPESAACANDLGRMLIESNSNAKVEIVAPILTEGGDKISSTLLRRMIKEGRLEEFLQLSGQSYALDISKVKGNDLVIRADEIHQLLPPEGEYESTLVLSDDARVRCIADIKYGCIYLFKQGGGCLESSKVQRKKLLLEKRR